MKARTIALVTLVAMSLFLGCESPTNGTTNGTTNGAVWVQTNGPYRGVVIRSLAVSDTTLLAGTDGKGVFLSEDNGDSWTQTSGLPWSTPDVFALAVSGTNRWLFAGTWGAGVFHSTNGRYWSGFNSGFTDPSYVYVYSLAVSDTNLFAGTSDGVFRSSINYGASWTQTGLTNPRVLSLAVSDTNLFAGTAGIWGGGGVFLSTDNGTTWTAVGLTNVTVNSLVVSGTNLFAGTNGGVFRSTDNGSTWRAASSGLTNTTVYSLAMSGANLFAGTDGGGVFLSEDNGASWTVSGLTGHTVRSLTVSDTHLFAGTDVGHVWRLPL